MWRYLRVIACVVCTYASLCACRCVCLCESITKGTYILSANQCVRVSASNVISVCVRARVCLLLHFLFNLKCRCVCSSAFLSMYFYLCFDLYTWLLGCIVIVYVVYSKANTCIRSVQDDVYQSKQNRSVNLDIWGSTCTSVATRVLSSWERTSFWHVHLS